MQQDIRSNITSGLLKKFNIEPENSLRSLLESVASSDGDPDTKISKDNLPRPSGNKEVLSTLHVKPKQTRLVTRSPLLMRRPSKSYDGTAEPERVPDRPKSDMGSFARREYTQNLSASVDRGRHFHFPPPQAHSSSIRRTSLQSSSSRPQAARAGCADFKRARDTGLRAATALLPSAPTRARGSSARSSPCSSAVGAVHAGRRSRKRLESKGVEDG